MREIKELDFKLNKGHAVCFDFHGVIHKYSKGWQDGSIYDTYNKEILDLMLFLQKAEIPIFICSTREPFQIINWWNKQDEILEEDVLKIFRKYLDKRPNRRVVKDKQEMLMRLKQGIIKNPSQYIYEFIKNRDNRHYHLKEVKE